MKAFARHLYRHSNGVFYFRYSMPELSSISSFEVVLSLKTRDIYQAKEIVYHLNGAISTFLSKCRNGN